MEKRETVVIQEVYECDNAEEMFEIQLEKALDLGCENIVIEPEKLGNEIARWITAGNCFHKTSVLSGVGTITSGMLWGDRPYIYLPMGLLATFCGGLYFVQIFDPCCKYQVLRDKKKLAGYHSSLPTSQPVVLHRRDSQFRRRKLVHLSVNLATVTFCLWKLLAETTEALVSYTY